MTAVTLDDTPLRQGCVGCGTQRTTVLHPFLGRLCDDCPSWRLLPVHLAWGALADHLAREARVRFSAAAGRLS